MPPAWQISLFTDILPTLLGPTKVLYETSIVLLGAKAKFLRRKPKVVVALDKISDMLTPINVLYDCYAKIFWGLTVFQGLLV